MYNTKWVKLKKRRGENGRWLGLRREDYGMLVLGTSCLLCFVITVLYYILKSHCCWCYRYSRVCLGTGRQTLTHSPICHTYLLLLSTPQYSSHHSLLLSLSTWWRRDDDLLISSSIYYPPRHNNNNTHHHHTTCTKARYSSLQPAVSPHTHNTQRTK